MRVGVYGESYPTLSTLLEEAGHHIFHMDYHPEPPAFAELDMVVLEVRDSLLEAAVERLSEQVRRGQIVIHTSLHHGVQIMDPLEVNGAVVIALGEISPTRWAVTTTDELGDTVAELLLGEIGASPFRYTEKERRRVAGLLTYVDALNSLRQEAMFRLREHQHDNEEPEEFISARGPLWPMPEVQTLQEQWEAIEDPGFARSFRQVVRRVAETSRSRGSDDIELWAIQKEKL